jgi:hypothetical protein
MLPAGTDSKETFTRLNGTGLPQDMDIQALRQGQQFLIFSARIRYTDIVGCDRVTICCLTRSSDLGWLIHGPPEFNSRT